METILAQTVTDWELIICDSYSDDGSWEFFQKFKGDPRIRMYQVPREGIYAGWNECLRRATGQYLNIATSDDTAEPTMLEKMIGELENRPEISLAVCNFRAIDENSNPLECNYKTGQQSTLGEWKDRLSIRNGKTEFLLQAALGAIWITLATVVMRRDLLTRTGLFRTDRKSRADEEWVLRASLASDLVWFPEALVTWRIHTRQATPQKADREGYRIYRTCLEAVVNDRQSGIPETWRAIPEWKQRITETRATLYRQTLKPYRWAARKNPQQFLRDLGELALHDRAWLVELAKSGFTTPVAEVPDCYAVALDLIKLFGAAWPPSPICRNATVPSS